MTRKNIAILYTGGTIGMRPSAEGLRPHRALKHQYQHPFGDKIRVTWYETEQLIDSSNITLYDWQTLFQMLPTLLSEHDGVLILHGTDTLAYSANLLGIAFGDVKKPIVLTGAQKPFGVADSDARDNLDSALASFLLHNFKCGVALVFNGQLFPAIGCQKVSTEKLQAFDNTNFQTAASDFIRNLNQAVKLPTIAPLVHATPAINPKVRVVCHTLTPGASTQMIAHSLRHFASDALIIESYGHGNLPNCPDLLSALAAMNEQGRLMLNISQVAHANVAQVYAQNRLATDNGLINAGSLQREGALGLLTLACSLNVSHNEVRAWLQHFDRHAKMSCM